MEKKRYGVDHGKCPVAGFQRHAGAVVFNVVGGRPVVCKAPARLRVHYQTLARQRVLPNAYRAAVAEFVGRHGKTFNQMPKKVGPCMPTV